MNKLSLLLISLAALSAPALNVSAQTFSAHALEQRMVERRAVDAAIWGMPIVSLDFMRQAYFRDGKAKYGDIIWWPKNNDWRNQSLTPNTSVRYLYVFLNTKEQGPVVLELPAAANGSSLLGTMADAWQVPLTDMGDDGKAIRFLVLPPDYSGEVPASYTPVRPKTYNTFTTIRSILAGNSPTDVRSGDALVQQIRIYPLAKAGSPAEQHFVDMTNVRYDGLVRFDESLYVSLARMLNEEPAQPEDLQVMGLLLPLGIEKGTEFKPDSATEAQLKSAAAEAHAWLRAQIPKFATEWWPGSHWVVPGTKIAMATGFKWQVPNYFDVDSRGIGFSTFFLPPAKLGGGSFYLGASFDSKGQPLGASGNYRLHVPANVPVSQFWAVTVYSNDTNALFVNVSRPTLDSLDPNLQKSADGSVDIYIGAKTPAGHESNWIQIPAGKAFTPWFRFYGPQKGVFDKTWKMPDIEKIS